MNGLFKAITSAVGELQTLGASEWSSAISYPKGAIVYFEKDLYISQVDDNQNKPPQSWVSITSIANDSLKKVANLSDLTNKTTARNNLGLGSSATLNKTDTLGTSSNLVATQKLVNDTKINLESSKQDKLTFTGTGNVARMSEVDKKITGGSVVQGTGTSTTDVMSQKAVTDLIIRNGFNDVTSQRVKNTLYTNNTNKPIDVYIAYRSVGIQAINFNVNGVDFLVTEVLEARVNFIFGFSFTVMPGDKYKFYSNHVDQNSLTIFYWRER